MKKVLISMMMIAAALTLAGSGSFALLQDSETVNNVFSAATWSTSAIKVTIDIKPGESPNYINPRSNGVITVAVLSDSEFDATQIDESTVRFGPGEAEYFKYQYKDVNNDRINDILFYFKTQETGVYSGLTEMELTGQTLDGEYFSGSDSIVTVSDR